MSERTFRDNYAYFEALRVDTRRTMLTGKVQDDGSITMAGAPTNKTWVRDTVDSRRAVAVWGVLNTPNVPVRVEFNPEGELEIVGVNWNIGTPMFSDALPGVSQPPVQGDVQGLNVSDLNILHGRVQPSNSATTYIAIQPFEYNGARISPADTDVASAYPPDPDQYGRIGVYYNPISAAVVAFAGSSDYDLTTLLATDDRASVPAGMLPLGAVIVQNDSAGDPVAITSASYFESWRTFLSPNGYLLTGAAVTRTIAAGVITVGAESVIVAAAQSGTADDLDTLTVNTPRMGWIIADTGDTITIKHGVDNISCFGGSDIAITDTDAAVWVYDGTTVFIAGGGGGGASAFINLTDAPASYSGEGGKAVVVNAGETALEFVETMPIAAKTRVVGTVLWDKTNSSSASFDTNSSDDFGNSGAFATDYDWIEIFWQLRGAASAGGVNVRIAFNNDTTDSHYQVAYDSKGSSDTQALANNNRNIASAADAANTANYFSGGWAKIVTPGAAIFKAISSKMSDARSSSVHSVYDLATVWRDTSAITRIAIDANNATTTFVSGSRLIVIGYKREAIGGIAYSTVDVSTPPTDAELDSAFGTPATLPVPFAAVVNDNNGGTNEYLVWSDGTNWFYAAGTKAT